MLQKKKKQKQRKTQKNQHIYANDYLKTQKLHTHTHNFKNSALSVKSDIIITVLSIKKEFKTTDKTK